MWRSRVRRWSYAEVKLTEAEHRNWWHRTVCRGNKLRNYWHVQATRSITHNNTRPPRVLNHINVAISYVSLYSCWIQLESETWQLWMRLYLRKNRTIVRQSDTAPRHCYFYVALEMNTVIQPVKYCSTCGIRHSEVELLPCSCNCATTIC
jgi:hypothetical protein